MQNKLDQKGKTFMESWPNPLDDSVKESGKRSNGIPAQIEDCNMKYVYKWVQTITGRLVFPGMGNAHHFAVSRN